MSNRLNYSSATFSVIPYDLCVSTVAGYGYGFQQPPLAVRVGFVKCEYCATSQKRPDNGRCCACGGPTPHVDEAVYAR